MYAVVGQWWATLSARAGDLYIAGVNLLGSLIGK